MAGLPLTAQFASRWALLQVVAGADERWVIILALGAFGVLAGTLRAGRACFGPLRNSPVQREPLLLALLVVVLMAAGVMLGLLPQLLAATVAVVIVPLSSIEP